MSKKIKDNKNRLRSKTVGFRVSPEEWENFEIAVSLSGLSKQDYLISKIENRDIIVQGNPRVYKALRNNLNDVLVALNRIIAAREEIIDDELLEVIKLITITMNGLKNENDTSP